MQVVPVSVGYDYMFDGCGVDVKGSRIFLDASLRRSRFEVLVQALNRWRIYRQVL